MTLVKQRRLMVCTIRAAPVSKSIIYILCVITKQLLTSPKKLPAIILFGQDRHGHAANVIPYIGEAMRKTPLMPCWQPYVEACLSGFPASLSGVMILVALYRKHQRIFTEDGSLLDFLPRTHAPMARHQKNPGNTVNLF